MGVLLKPVSMTTWRGLDALPDEIVTLILNNLDSALSLVPALGTNKRLNRLAKEAVAYSRDIYWPPHCDPAPDPAVLARFLDVWENKTVELYIRLEGVCTDYVEEVALIVASRLARVRVLHLTMSDVDAGAAAFLAALEGTPANVLHELVINLWKCGACGITSRLFAGTAPCLQRVELEVWDPPSFRIPAFDAVQQLVLDPLSDNIDHPTDLISSCTNATQVMLRRMWRSDDPGLRRPRPLLAVQHVPVQHLFLDLAYWTGHVIREFGGPAVTHVTVMWGRSNFYPLRQLLQDLTPHMLDSGLRLAVDRDRTFYDDRTAPCSYTFTASGSSISRAISFFPRAHGTVLPMLGYAGTKLSKLLSQVFSLQIRLEYVHQLPLVEQHTPSGAFTMVRELRVVLDDTAQAASVSMPFLFPALASVEVWIPSRGQSALSPSDPQALRQLLERWFVIGSHVRLQGSNISDNYI